MEIRFHDLIFTVDEEDKLLLQRWGDAVCPENPRNRMELLCAGDDHPFHGGSFKRVCTFEGKAQRYLSHKQTEDCLTIITASDRLQVESCYTALPHSNAIRCTNTVTNISQEEITLEAASSLLLYGLAKQAVEESADWYLHRYRSCHHWECQPQVESLFDLGLYHSTASFRQANVGSWSSKEYFPQGILEDRKNSDFFMFQIESSTHWYFELGVLGTHFYLDLRGADASFHSWCKKLSPGQSYHCAPVAFCHGKSLNEVLGQMTHYRRSQKPCCEADEALPVIFNEYMHLSWDNPQQERTEALAPVMAQLGAQYYVVDCGWHDEVPTELIYPNVGQWKESKLRFPKGVKQTADKVHALGMKFGLWIEPEIIGKDCKAMLEHYPEEAFFHRNGHKIGEMGRLFLDYRHPKVQEYMSETIRRMVEDYGADYIKFDYNQDCGPGTETNADSLGDGLLAHAKAFHQWVKEIQAAHPHVIFENCASGGQRMDALTLSHFPLTSTSDQIYYYYYPYVAANVLTAVIPEQAAVWSYPMNRQACKACPEDPQSLVSPEVVVINMINSLLGRIHLASPLNLLPEEKQQLVAEGIAYYHSMTPTKKHSVPYLPLGYAKKGDGTVAVGIHDQATLYLAVWNLHGQREVSIPLGDLSPKSAKVGYPLSLPTDYRLEKDCLILRFTEDEQARLFEIKL